MSSPKRNLEKLNRIINAWQTLAPDKAFGGMTVAHFKTQVQSSLDTRAQVERLEAELDAAQAARDNADKENLRLAELVVNGVVGDPTVGPNSDLYEGMGYVRDSERRSGLTRKKRVSSKQ
jgi:hypothetical protein